jgi:hypothetical protein
MVTPEFLEANLFVNTPGIPRQKTRKRKKGKKKCVFGGGGVEGSQEGIIYTPRMQSNNFPRTWKNLRGCGRIGKNTATLFEKLLNEPVPKGTHFWLLGCSFCFTLWDRIMMQ